MINYTARSGYGELAEVLLQLGAEEIIPDYELEMDEELATGEPEEGSDWNAAVGDIGQDELSTMKKQMREALSFL